MDAFRLGNFYYVKEPFLRLSSCPVRLTNLFVHFYRWMALHNPYKTGDE